MGREVHCTERTLPSCECWCEFSGCNKNATDGSAHPRHFSQPGGWKSNIRRQQVPSLVGPHLFTHEPPHTLALSPLSSKGELSGSLLLRAPIP